MVETTQRFGLENFPDLARFGPLFNLYLRLLSLIYRVQTLREGGSSSRIFPLEALFHFSRLDFLDLVLFCEILWFVIDYC